jgi:glutamate N-acetyltransferase / amino-acid N-acetyltransferase
LNTGLNAGFKFTSVTEYINHLKTISALPKGFSVGTTRFMFRPAEVDKMLPMNLTIIKLDEPTSSFAAMFTSNQFPGGPVLVGKDRLANSEFLQAVVVNNKISNVCPGSGVTDRGIGDSEQVCQYVADALELKSKDFVFPSSTGIIGWRLPVGAMKVAIVSFQLSFFLLVVL